MINGRFLFNLILLAGSAVGFVAARGLPPAFSPGQIGPGFFPSIVAGLGIVVMICVLVGDLRDSRAGTVTALPQIERKSALGALAVVALVVGYIVVIGPVGFEIATAGFLFFGVLVCHATLEPAQIRPLFSFRFLGVAAVTAICVMFATHSIFTYGFGLNLP